MNPVRLAPREFRPIIREAVKHGWRVTVSGGGHLRLQGPKRGLVFASMTLLARPSASHSRPSAAGCGLDLGRGEHCSKTSEAAIPKAMAPPGVASSASSARGLHGGGSCTGGVRAPPRAKEIVPMITLNFVRRRHGGPGADRWCTKESQKGL